MTASIWLAMPNIGQMAAKALASRKYHQPREIRAVDEDRRGPPVGLAKAGMNPFAHGFLQEETADARAGVDGGENEQGLEHDGEVVPVFEKIAEPVGGFGGGLSQ